MNLTDLKKVAKDCNVVLSIGGKAKGKSQLVSDILAKN
jgi:molybdopterin biosynthesis enzyme